MNKKDRKYKLTEIENQPHIGKMLHDLYKKRRVFQSALARKLNRRYETVFQYQKKASIQVAILWELSHALKHNFFKDIAAMMPAEYASNAPQETSQAEQIVALTEQVKLLTAERDMALKLMGK